MADKCANNHYLSNLSDIVDGVKEMIWFVPYCLMVYSEKDYHITTKQHLDDLFEVLDQDGIKTAVSYDFEVTLRRNVGAPFHFGQWLIEEIGYLKYDLSSAFKDKRKV